MSVATIGNKRLMYRLLADGSLGNTIPQWFDIDSWEADARSKQYQLWGIRSAQAGGDKRMRLNVPREEAAELYRGWFPLGGGNISPMIDMYAVLRGEVYDSDFGEPFGLNLFYVPPGSKIDPADPWRGSFKNYGTRASGINALNILKANLWPGDLADIQLLLERYPAHVIEFSACNRAVGVIPNRNTVIWEVRKY